MKQRLAAVLASVFGLMSCDLAQAQTAAMQINTGYAPGYWYRNPLGSAGMTGAAYGAAGRVTCTPYYVSGPSGMTASAVGATLTTTDASNYASFAIYSASGNFPGSLIDFNPEPRAWDGRQRIRVSRQGDGRAGAGGVFCLRCFEFNDRRICWRVEQRRIAGILDHGRFDGRRRRDANSLYRADLLGRIVRLWTELVGWRRVVLRLAVLAGFGCVVACLGGKHPADGAAIEAVGASGV